jgi:hypothetical protein
MVMVLENMILDATAGERTMYQNKTTPNIIYLDIEKKLRVKPTIIADDVALPFKPKTFHTIFFDPPHDYGRKPFDFNFGTVPAHKHIVKHKPFSTTYYGWDKYQTKQHLITYIWRAQEEFKQVLADDGLLWLKWCEVRIPLYRILAIFADWTILLIINVADPTHTWGGAKTYWVCLTKKQGGRVVPILA